MRAPPRPKSWSRANIGASYGLGRPMPTSSPRTAYQTGWRINSPAPLRGGDPLSGRIKRARAVLAIERVLPRLWPAAGFIGLYLALALAGAFAFVPWPVQALALAATITLSALALAEGFSDFVWPRSLDAERRLERDS